jgi:hypothetical protein
MEDVPKEIIERQLEHLAKADPAIADGARNASK